MTTPFEPNHYQENDSVGQLEYDAETRDLYGALDRAGTTWRTQAQPNIKRVDERLRATLSQMQATEAGAPHATQLTDVAVTNTKRGNPSMLQTERPRPRLSGWRLWASAGVTVALVVAFLATFAVVANQRGAGKGSVQTEQSATPSAKPGVWVNLTNLDANVVFSANDQPAIAPSNPNVVYETSAWGWHSQPATMRATTDGGKTWRALTLPVQASHVSWLGAVVSPANARTVFLSVIDADAAECPANRLDNNPDIAFCRLQYTSLDGGQNWTMTGLPLGNGGMPGILSDGAEQAYGAPTLRATAGGRLYAEYVCIDFFSCARLVTSNNGGRTWSFADTGLIANGAVSVCDYTVNAQGTHLYAVTATTSCSTSQTPLTLWRSDNGGGSWAMVGQLATPNERGMILTQNSVTGAMTLYMGLPQTEKIGADKAGGALPYFTSSPSDVKVSVDGGMTWQSAPMVGIPANHVVFFQVGLLGALSDGSVLLDVIPSSDDQGYSADNGQGSDLYAWKPGDTAWRHIASVPIEIDSLLVAPGAHGDGDTLYTVFVNRVAVVPGSNSGVVGVPPNPQFPNTYTPMRLQLGA